MRKGEENWLFIMYESWEGRWKSLAMVGKSSERIAGSFVGEEDDNERRYSFFEFEKAASIKLLKGSVV